MVRASALEAGGHGFDTGEPRHEKMFKKMVPVATLLGAQHYKASTAWLVFSAKKKVINMITSISMIRIQYMYVMVMVGVCGGWGHCSSIIGVW